MNKDKFGIPTIYRIILYLVFACLVAQTIICRTKKCHAACAQVVIQKGTKVIPGNVFDELQILFADGKINQDEKKEQPEMDFFIVSYKTKKTTRESFKKGIGIIYEDNDIGVKYTIYLLNAEGDTASFIVNRENS